MIFDRRLGGRQCKPTNWRNKTPFSVISPMEIFRCVHVPMADIMAYKFSEYMYGSKLRIQRCAWVNISNITQGSGRGVLQQGKPCPYVTVFCTNTNAHTYTDQHLLAGDVINSNLNTYFLTVTPTYTILLVLIISSSAQCIIVRTSFFLPEHSETCAQCYHHASSTPACRAWFPVPSWRN